MLAGLAFAGSGYIACQLKHLAIVSTVVWLPVGLTLIDLALGARTPTSGARRALFMAAFGLVFAQQVLSGFPQSAYICALVYGSFALFRVAADRARLGRWPAWLALLGGLGVATALGAAAGAVVLLPLSELGSVSDRAEDARLGMVDAPSYWVPNLLTFLVPYVNGDISDNTYIGSRFFWEDYGYVGLAPFVLALYGGAREWRRPAVAFAIVMTIVAYLFVLGAATPVFRVAYLLVPGMSMFRFPTRFLIVVELGIALLGAIGLTRLAADLKERWPDSVRVRLIVLAVCAGTAVDLFIHQPRQNPMVPAAEWLAAPPSVAAVNADSRQPRTFTPRHRDAAPSHVHGRARLGGCGPVLRPSRRARAEHRRRTSGIRHRQTVTPALRRAGRSTCGATTIANQRSYRSSAYLDFDAERLRIHPALPAVLRTYGVSHVLSPYPQQEAAWPLVSQTDHAYVYRVEGAARVRFVRAARRVTSDREAFVRLRDAGFDPDREILLHEAPDSVGPRFEDSGEAAAYTVASRPVVTHEDSRQLVIDAEAPEDGFLLLADTFYPGWSAYVDGQPTPIYRANIAVRGIQLPKGRHEIRFTYAAPAFVRGLWITLLSLSALLVWLGTAAYLDRRSLGGG